MSEKAPSRTDFAVMIEMNVRWRDADVYGHVNNAVYYEYVDTAVNSWLRGSGALNVPNSDRVGLVVHSECRFFSALSFPGPIRAGLGVERIGNTSVTYRVALFADDAVLAAALARFTHVYVDHETHRPQPLPDAFRRYLEKLRDGDRA